MPDLAQPLPVTALPTPCLLLDEAKFTRNVERMRDHLAALGARLRPHLKTAKCLEVARRVMTAPSGPGTVSTLREAEFFAAGGVRDLVYAVGIAPDKLDVVGAIRRRHQADLAVILDSVEQAQAVAAWSAERADVVPALIEIDADNHRGGVAPDEAERLIAIGRILDQGKCELRGVLTHAGASYALHRPADLQAAAAAERDAVVGSARLLREAGLPCPVVSLGSTPTATFARDLSGVTEVRAGVYMFGDLVQAGVGSCTADDIAISVLATVIGHQRAKGWLIVDAGWMAMSRDRGTAKQAVDQGYGLVCDAAGRIHPNLVMIDANQEHGIIAARPGSQAIVPDLPLGARLRILPNHACATAAPYEAYQVIGRDGMVAAQWPRINGW
jgi:D-serine deaminase-like pyridoxal phosphate-dependent protein